MVFCYILCTVLIMLLLLHSLFEVHYFLRMVLCVLLARFTKKKAHIMDLTSVGGICLTTDIDTLITHMNNARYIRELDFARVDFYERTGLYKTILSKGGGIVQGAATIRYRRFIKPFSRYEITSKILYWDQQTIFFEHQFIGKSDGFIHAIVLCRQRVINCSAEDIMSTLLAEDATDSGFEKLEVGDLNKVKPEMPLEVTKWIESNDISSANLRRE